MGWWIIFCVEGKQSMKNKLKEYYWAFRQWWYEHDSIELVLFASLAFCVGWGLYHVILGLIGRFL